MGRLKGRPPMPEGQRTKKIDVRFTEVEFQAILDMERALGLSKTEILRSRLLHNSKGLTINAHSLIDQLDRLGNDLATMTRNVNQLAGYAAQLLKRDILHPDIMEKYTMMLRDYNQLMTRMERTLRKVIRQMI